MSTLGAIRRSNVARFGTYGLVVLWYAIFALGSLLQVGFGGGGDLRTQAIRFGVASVGFVLIIGLLRWFFETQGG